jgi:hypothetical protein
LCSFITQKLIFRSTFMLCCLFDDADSRLVCIVRIKLRVFWDVVPCSHVEVDRCFRVAYCLHRHRHDEGGSTPLCNVGQLQRDYTALHPRRLYTSYSPPWEPEISHVYVQAKVNSSAKSKKSKAVPLHAMEALGGRGSIAPTHSRPRH